MYHNSRGASSRFRFWVGLWLAGVGLVACRGSGIPSIPISFSPSSGSAVDVRAAEVTRIVDGDTVGVEIDGRPERVRLIGIDTPERGRPLFEEASDFAAKHLSDQTVYLESDVDERDRYGRLLAYVWMDRPLDASESEIRARMFNARSLLEGYASLLTVPPNVRYVDRFVQFQREARAEQRGLWR